MAEHTTAEVLELAGAFRIPHAPIGNGATIPATDHFAGPRLDRAEPARTASSSPTARTASTRRSSAARARAPARRARRPCELRDREVDPADRPDGGLPFDGLRVLDLTSFWAGPLCTHVLAMLGAEVLHVESTARPDGTRLLAGLRFSEPDWWEQSGIFSGLNTNKKSVTLDLATERGRELLRRPDRHLRRRSSRTTRRGCSSSSGSTSTPSGPSGPTSSMVRMPGFGLDGPWRDDPAFAFVIEDAAGLTWMTGHPDQNPVSPYCVGDSNAGIHAAARRCCSRSSTGGRTGEGVLVEASMVDAALNVAAEQVVEHSAYGALLERDGNRGPTAAPQNLYLTADTDDAGERDAWVAIAVADRRRSGSRCATRSAARRGRWIRSCRPRRPAASSTTASTGTSRRGAPSGAATRSSSASGRRASRWPRCCSRTSRRRSRRSQHRGFFEDVDHPVTGTVPAQHAADAVLAWPGAVPPSAAPRCSASTPTRCCAASGSSDDELAELEARRRDRPRSRRPAR